MPRGRRPRPWTEAAVRYALPHLPGDWLAFDGGLIRQPVGLIARGVTPQPGQPQVILHPLYLPLDAFDSGWKLGHECWIPEYFHNFRSVAEGESYMAQLVPALRDVVIPYFEENGTLEGYLRRCRRINDGHPNGLGDVWHLFYQAATAIILKRGDEAAECLAAVQHIASLDTDDPPPWLLTLSIQAGALRGRLLADLTGTRTLLLAGTAEQRRRRGLPLQDEVAPS